MHGREISCGATHAVSVECVRRAILRRLVWPVDRRVAVCRLCVRGGPASARVWLFHVVRSKKCRVSRWNVVVPELFTLV